MIIIIGPNFSVSSSQHDYHRLLLLFIRILNPIANKEFCIVYVHMSTKGYLLFLLLLFFININILCVFFFFRSSAINISFLRNFHSILPREYKKNLKLFLVLFPTLTLTLAVNAAKSFLSSKTSKKLYYFNRSVDICKFIHADQLPLPFEVIILLCFFFSFLFNNNNNK